VCTCRRGHVLVLACACACPRHRLAVPSALQRPSSVSCVWRECVHVLPVSCQPACTHALHLLPPHAVPRAACGMRHGAQVAHPDTLPPPSHPRAHTQLRSQLFEAETPANTHVCAHTQVAGADTPPLPRANARTHAHTHAQVTDGDRAVGGWAAAAATRLRASNDRVHLAVGSLSGSLGYIFSSLQVELAKKPAGDR
jgi:hypothetical protein